MPYFKPYHYGQREDSLANMERIRDSSEKALWTEFRMDMLYLDSRSVWPHHASHDTMIFHQNKVHCSFQGSYTQAKDYLTRQTDLFAGKNYMKQLWDRVPRTRR